MPESHAGGMDGNGPARRQQAKPVPDERREPRLISDAAGRRLISLAALTERAEAAFAAEYSERSAAVRAADTRAKRLKLILNTVDYTLTMEAVQLSQEEKAALIRQVYSSLFGYGPLDALFSDARITTIALEGAERVAVRYGHSELTALEPRFQHELHLRRMIERLMLDAGAEMRPDQPVMEVGLRVGARPVCLNLMMPPLTAHINADIRLHPGQPPAVDDLTTVGFFTAEAAQLLNALAGSPHGLVIVGDAESGKTTLLTVLAQWLPDPEHTTAVERAGELRLPAGIARRTVRWPAGDAPGVTFGRQIDAALEESPACLLLDEVRSDEPAAVAPLLNRAEAPRQIWTFRGAPYEKRLRSALTMLARRADMAHGEAMVQALYDRLPFVITVTRRDGRLHLRSVAEWQPSGAEYPELVALMAREGGGLYLTGRRPLRELNLPERFWQQG